jgi:aryl-alcohol dehydrogenase-like predicted oxidoreductase
MKTLMAALDLFGSFTDTAKVYGVSDVTIRNWCKDYGIERHWYRTRKGRKPKKRKKVMS